MKKLLSLVAALILAIGFGATTASAQMYMSGNLGVVMVSDADVSLEGITFAELTFDTGLGLTAGLGHAYGNGLRSEIELGYRANDLDKAKIDPFIADLAGVPRSIPLNGDVSSLSLMVNGYYDFQTGGPITPFVGGGLGFARVSLDSSILGIDENNTVFAYQLAAGGSISLNPRLNLDLQYRFFGTSDPKFTDDEGDRIKIEYMTHNLMVGLRYSF
jgi:outer membrane immunogenic protein